MRHEIDMSRKIKPILGGPVTFRTLADGAFGLAKEDRRMIDRLVTITLPAIDGENWKIKPTMSVDL
jgi:hypothetical protein